MYLFLFAAPHGYHRGAWRMDDSLVEKLYTLSIPQWLANEAEAASVHALFFADWLSFGNTGENPDLTGYEPLTTMAAIAATTSRIGLIGTASTTFWEPFHLARIFSQLDHLSNGRAGWNIVTSTTGQENFTMDLPSHDERYARAYEYLETVLALWTAWRSDAVLNDRASGVWADRTKIELNVHPQGPTYSVKGPLLVPRSPQGIPVLAQAGSSVAGIRFAATYAEVVFSVANSIEEGIDFRDRVRAEASLRGRNPDAVKVLPGLMPILGHTAASAANFDAELLELVQQESSITILNEVLADQDISKLDLDRPIPDGFLIPPDEAARAGAISRYFHFYRLAVENRLTVRQLAASASRAEGHRVFVGTYAEAADMMHEWVSRGACDGFVMMPPSLPRGLTDITRGVIPLLQQRGHFQNSYRASSLRAALQ